jgi:hypothetical protein
MAIRLEPMGFDPPGNKADSLSDKANRRSSSEMGSRSQCRANLLLGSEAASGLVRFRA